MTRFVYFAFTFIFFLFICNCYCYFFFRLRPEGAEQDALDQELKTASNLSLNDTGKISSWSNFQGAIHKLRKQDFADFWPLHPS